MSSDYELLDVMEKDSRLFVFVVADDVPGSKEKVTRDMTGWTLDSRIRVADDPNADLAPTQFQVSFRNSKLGLIEVFLPKDHGLKAGTTYYYEIRGTAPDGLAETLLIGHFDVARSEFQWLKI